MGYDPKEESGPRSVISPRCVTHWGVAPDEALEVGDVLDRIREMTGIYGLGFRRESILGLVVPIAFVILVGGAIALLILLRR